MAALFEAGPLEKLEQPLLDVRELFEADARPSYSFECWQVSRGDKQAALYQ